MKIRIAITLIWIIFFLTNVLIIINYFNGIVLLEEDNLLEYLNPIIKLYAPYITGILAFWYLKPFPYSKLDESIIFRYWLALGLTLFFNLLVTFFVLRYYFTSDSFILDNINNGVKIGFWMSIIVGSINAYLFGMKVRESA